MAVAAILIATGNPGKAEEIKTLLSGLDCEILSLADLPPLEPCPETGSTYEENAVRKAVHFSRAVPHLTIADDSGLEVEALGGAPGARSARFGGEAAGSAEKCRLLLDRLRDVPEEKRAASFRCVVALARAGTLLRVFHGSCRGVIAPAPRGARGFGYDPVFFYPPLGRTFAELTPSEKNQVSHRTVALRALAECLQGPGRSLLSVGRG